MEYNKSELIKGGNQEQFEVNEIRERIISKYCTVRGWDPSNLTPEQLNEIKKQKEYINPGIVLG